MILTICGAIAGAFDCVGIASTARARDESIVLRILGSFIPIDAFGIPKAESPYRFCGASFAEACGNWNVYIEMEWKVFRIIWISIKCHCWFYHMVIAWATIVHFACSSHRCALLCRARRSHSWMSTGTWWIGPWWEIRRHSGLDGGNFWMKKLKGIFV